MMVEQSIEGNGQEREQEEAKWYEGEEKGLDIVTTRTITLKGNTR